MLAASRPYALAAAALAAVSTVVVTPVLARQVPLAVRQIETKLVDVGIDNIPMNLFDDILNIPYNETVGGGLATMANSFLFTGTWWVPSSSNLWGIDPGDPTHIALIDNFLPFTAFTEGFTNSAGVYEPGLNYEFAGLLAAELPVSSSCDAASCFPMTPPEVVTGSTQFDRDIGFFDALMGKATDANGEPFGLFTNFFHVPLQELINGYTFGSNDPGIVDPSGPVQSLYGWGTSGNPFEGGTGAGNTMPWDGVTYHLNLLQPFQTFYDSLLQTPATDGIGGTGIESFTSTDVAHTFENLLAGSIISFDPFTEGSPACPALCNIPSQDQVPGLIAELSKMDPSNTTLSDWVTNYAIDPSLVNEPTQDQINASVALLQTGVYNLNIQELTDVDKGLASINAELPQLLTNAGYYTDPAYVQYSIDPSSVTDPTTGQIDTVYGGYNPQEVFNDMIIMFGTQTNVSQLSNAELLWFLADPLSSPDPYNGGVVDGAAAVPGLFSSAAADSVGGSSALGQFSTDLSALFASFGTTAGADALSAALSELSAQISADLASFVPQSVLSMF
ncbi:hypothetical protein GCM10009641_72180 [Mycobacterium cookii]|uniref:PE-PPE domain-containing protein n=1 Tax=Mycobacterium cookii TaxID=1775 RepID=A0A7I7KUM0_9MYCO|nr:hypothetical protein [Mycobacterium cookii]MCV7331452.1 hypothetical protein [Mycobacterium cookii]BBX45805.1 hypothetical protein MCOO_18200 [Mycobacterium cookii]